MVKYEKLRAALAQCTPAERRKRAPEKVIKRADGTYEAPACLVELAAAAAGRFVSTGEGGEDLAMLLKERDELRAQLDGKAPSADDDWWGLDK